MFNPGNQGDKNNSFFELVDNDFLMNFIADQQPIPYLLGGENVIYIFRSSVPRTTSNPQFFNQNFQQFPMNSFNSNQFGSYTNQDRVHLESVGQNYLDKNWNGFEQAHFPYGQLQMPFPGAEPIQNDFPRQNLQIPNQVYGFVKDENPQQQQPHQAKHKPRQKKKTLSPMKTPKQFIQDDTGLLKQNSDLFTYKNNLKNTYINKISSLMSQENIKAEDGNKKQNQEISLIQQSMKSEKSSESSEERRLSSHERQEDAKLIRNRECARNSRKRKKIYIELLENKVKNLSAELEKASKVLKSSTSYLNKLSQNQTIQGFFLGKLQLFEKLEKSLMTDSDPQEINLLLDSMRLRVGGGGKERINVANSFFNQLLELTLPVHIRYVLWSATQNKDIFFENPSELVSDEVALENWAPWSKELAEKINLTETQKALILKFKRKLQHEKLKIEELIKRFANGKDSIYSRTSSFENFVDDLRNILSPAQMAKFLIGIEKNKSQKEMRVMRIFDADEKNTESDVDNVKEEPDLEVEPIKKVHL